MEKSTTYGLSWDQGVGIDYTIVNGQVIFEGQSCTGARPGARLCSAAYDPEAAWQV